MVAQLPKVFDSLLEIFVAHPDPVMSKKELVQILISDHFEAAEESKCFHDHGINIFIMKAQI